MSNKLQLTIEDYIERNILASQIMYNEIITEPIAWTDLEDIFGISEYDERVWTKQEIAKYRQFMVVKDPTEDAVDYDWVTLKEFRAILKRIPNDFLLYLYKKREKGMLEGFILDKVNAWSVIYEKAKKYFDVWPNGIVKYQGNTIGVIDLKRVEVKSE